jgi:hypothetical protein
MTARTDILLWAQRVVAKKGAPANQILDLPTTATLEHAQQAFHKLARTAHPDLHRNSVTPEELELITQAYATAASAYQTYRSQTMTTSRLEPLKDAVPAGATAKSGVQTQMNSRAIVYYRKAELALRRGDLAGALLQLKMAIAADPQSAFLRTALAEVENELRKSPT